MFKLNTKFDAYSLLYLLSHSECDGHTAHMLTQQHLLPPLTSTVKSSLFTHVHSSPLSLAAGLHRCHANCSCYINNSWMFFQIDLVCETLVTLFSRGQNIKVSLLIAFKQCVYDSSWSNISLFSISLPGPSNTI